MSKFTHKFAPRAMFLAAATMAGFLLVAHPSLAAAYTAPSGLSLSRGAGTGTSTSITINWTDNSSGAACYKVERDTGSGFIQIATTAAGATSSIDANLGSNTYAYRVRAYYCDGDSAYSNIATTTTPIIPAPVAYWKLDGNSSDSAGTNNGSDSNMTYATSSGVINQGGIFNGSSSEIDIGHVLSGFVNLSVFAWIKTTSDGFIVSQRNSGTMNGQWGLALRGGKVTIFTEGGGNGLGDASGNSTVTDGNWHLVGATQNGTTYTFYVDGVQDGSITGGTATAYDSNLLGAIGIDRRGGLFTPGHDPFNGAIDEVGVWDTTISADQVISLYGSGAGRPFMSF